MRRRAKKKLKLKACKEQVILPRFKKVEKILINFGKILGKKFQGNPLVPPRIGFAIDETNIYVVILVLSNKTLCCRANGFDISKKCIAFLLKALNSFETSVTTYPSSQRHIPDNLNSQLCSCKNRKYR
jgi:hypothetical protein